MSQAVARDGDMLVTAGFPIFGPNPTIIATATKTKVNGKKVARVGDYTTRHFHGIILCYGIMSEGSTTVKAEGKEVCRVGDHANCYHATLHILISKCVVSVGSPDTKAGG